MKNMNIERIPLVLKPTNLLGKVLFLNSQKLVGEMSTLKRQAGPFKSKSWGHADGYSNSVLLLDPGQEI